MLKFNISSKKMLGFVYFLVTLTNLVFLIKLIYPKVFLGNTMTEIILFLMVELFLIVYFVNYMIEMKKERRK